jgi:hypothetical protein
MGKRIRITVKRRAEIDVDKLVFALLRAIEEQQSAAQNQSVSAKTKGGGASRSGEESAA